MNTQQIIKVYLILSVVTCLLCPFTGIIALSNAIKALRTDIIDLKTIDFYLSRSYKWIIISLIVFVIIYVVLITFFLTTYNNQYTAIK